MNIEYFRHFVTIVDEGTILDASKKLYIAQPSLTNEIKLLEKEYETTLFDRNSRRMSLTSSGKLLYEEAKKVISTYDGIKTKMFDNFSGKIGTLKIAIPPTIYSSMLKNCFGEFIEKYPDIKLDIHESSTKQAEEMLFDGIINLAITNANITKTDHFEYLNIAEEKLKVFVDKNHPLVKKKNIEISDLMDQKIVIPRGYYEYIKQECNEKKVKLLDYILTNSSLGAVEVAKMKNYIAIAPFPKNETIHTCLIEKNFINDNNLTFKRKIVWLKMKNLSKVEQNFIEIFYPNYFA